MPRCSWVWYQKPGTSGSGMIRNHVKSVVLDFEKYFSICTLKLVPAKADLVLDNSHLTRDGH